jgi:hypothetical protein
MRVLVRRRYVMTTDADEEADRYALSIFDIESVIPTAGDKGRNQTAGLGGKCGQ